MKAIKVEKNLFLLFVLLLPSQLGKHFWPTSAFVGGLRIDYLSPTLFLSDLIILALLTIWVFGKSQGLKFIALKKGKFLLYLPIILLLTAANIFFSRDKLTSLYYWLRLGELVALFLYLKNTTQDNFAQLYRYLPIAVIYSSLIALAQFFLQSSVGGLLYWLGERRFTITTPGIAKTVSFERLLLRPYATFPHPNALAGFILIALTLLLPAVSKGGLKGLKNKLAFITYLLGTATLLISFSLSSWIALALLLTTWLLIRRRKKVLSVVSLSLVVLVLLIVVQPPEAESLTHRLLIAKDAITMIQINPLTGVGLGNFIPSLNKVGQEGRSYISPFLFYQPVHNIYLLLAAEAGVIVLLFFTLFLIKSLVKAKQSQRLEVALALLGIATIGMVDHYWLTLHQPRLLFTIVLAMAWRRTLRP